MRKMLALTVAIGVLAGVVAGPAAASDRGRLDRAIYVGPAAESWFRDTCGHAFVSGCVTFPTNPNESFISIEVRDLSLSPVEVYVTQRDADGGNFRMAVVCGTTTAPVKITPGVPVDIFLMPEDPLVYGNPCGYVDTPTAGTIKVRFTHRSECWAEMGPGVSDSQLKPAPVHCAHRRR